MRWTLWLILLLICSIYEKLIEPVDRGTSHMVIVVLILSGIMLFKDYLEKRR